jgi:hypothetical protein
VLKDFQVPQVLKVQQVIQEPKVLKELQQVHRVILVLRVLQEDRGLKELRVLIQVLKVLRDHRVQ